MVKYNITTKHERDSETRFPYINPFPLLICIPKMMLKSVGFCLYFAVHLSTRV